MARLLATLLATATALLVVGQLCDASQSEAEEFWGTVLPNSPLPDAILRLLHPDNSVNQAKHVDAEGPGQLSRLFPLYSSSGHSSSSSEDDNSGRLSRLFPIYHSSKPLPQMPSDEDNTGRFSRLFPLYHSSKPSSKMPSDEDNTSRLSRLFPLYHSSKPSQMTSDEDNTGRLSRLFPLYHSSKPLSHMPSDEDNTGRLSRLFPLYHSSKPTSQMPSDEDNTGRLSRLFPLYHSSKPSSQMPSDEDNSGRFSRLFPLYHSSKPTSQMPSDEDNNGRFSRLFPLYHSSKPSQMPSDEHNTGRLSRLFPLYHSSKPSSHMPADEDNTGRLSRLFPLYHSSKPSSQMPFDEDNSGRFSRLFPLYHSSKPSSSMPSGDGNTGGPLLHLVKGSHKHSSPKTFISDDNTVLAAIKAAFFFHEEALQVGKNMSLYFPPAVTAPLGLLPRHVADSIPFSASSLLGVLAQLGTSADSMQAANMQPTLDMCVSLSSGEEDRFCATSLEALVEGAIVTLGSSDIKPVTSILPSSGAPLQAYTIRGVRPVEGSSFVACHDQDYPYTVYVCHATGSARAYMVDVEGASSDVVTAVTICHTDTSGWDPEHMSFKFLGAKPGGAPVCHMLPYGNIMWAKNEIRSSA